MKARKSVSYFPVDVGEQALLLRVREPDLAGRVAELAEMLDQIAEAGLSSAELAQAIQLWTTHRQGEGLDARFDNLEARLKERIEKGLAEAEGRLSQRLASEPGSSTLPEHDVAPTPLLPPSAPAGEPVPKQASVAFRLGSELVWGESAAQFYVAIWRWLFEHGHVRLTDLPIGTAGKKRFELASSPVHPSGSPFYRAEEPVPGAFLEVNLSRGDIVRRARKYLTLHGVPHVVVVGADEE